MKKILSICALAGVLGIGCQKYLGQFSDKGVIGRLSYEPNYFVSSALGDMDGDGDLDMIVAGKNSVRYLENIGTLTEPKFQEKGILGNPDLGYSEIGADVKLVDINGDGKLDIVIVTPGKIKYFESNIPQKKNE